MKFRNLIVTSTLLLLSAAEKLDAVQLDHSFSPSHVVVGGRLTYTYGLRNDGATDESGTLFTNKLPINSVLVSAIVTNGEFTISNNVFSFRPDRLPAGETTVIQLQVTPVTAANLTNRACWVTSTGIPVYAFSLAPVDSAVSGPELNYGRMYHTSTTLNDGRVLVTGGHHRASPIDLAPTRTAEVYLQAEDRFQVVGNMAAARMWQTATLLNNGMVLIAGGQSADDGLPQTAEIFDPSSNAFSVAATLQVSRSSHTATLLPDGDVILAGGSDIANLVERLHCENGTWRATAAGYLLVPRKRHAACLLSDGRILYAGGGQTTNNFAEVFDPGSGNSHMMTNSGTRLQALAASRGRILLQGWLPGYVSAGEIYDFDSNTFIPMAPPVLPDDSQQSHFITLNNGELLQTGGDCRADVNVYDLRAGTCRPAPPLAVRRGNHSAARLRDGRILLTGGNINNEGSGYMQTTELYAFQLDSDLDGMDDQWELANGFDPARREDAVEDADGDGHTNLQEFLAGTDPRDPVNVLKIERPERIGDAIRIRFPSVLGKYYRVERSDGHGPNSWVVVADSLAGTGRPIEIMDPLQPGSSHHFFRVMLLP